jgi:hypothetical protein
LLCHENDGLLKQGGDNSSSDSKEEQEQGSQESSASSKSSSGSSSTKSKPTPLNLFDKFKSDMFDLVKTNREEDDLPPSKKSRLEEQMTELSRQMIEMQKQAAEIVEMLQKNVLMPKLPVVIMIWK